MKHFLPASLLAFGITATHTAGAVDPAVVISSQAEPSGSSDGGPAAAARLRRAVVAPDLLGATAAANLPTDGLRSPALAETDSVELDQLSSDYKKAFREHPVFSALKLQERGPVGVETEEKEKEKEEEKEEELSPRLSPDKNNTAALRLRGMEHIRAPCPPGYMDQTNGTAKWWRCGWGCPGEPWTDIECKCACVSSSASPSKSPSESPSSSPSTSPSSSPSALPSASRSASPSASPSKSPSSQPSRSPSMSPSTSPSASPSTSPSASPSTSPSLSPSLSPSASPSASPSKSPSESPSSSPSASPSSSPSEECRKDGESCASGTSCNGCCQGHNWWYTNPQGFKCGPAQGKWSDGTGCALGTSCNQCLNKASYWNSKASIRCGSEPGWVDGTSCALGSSCNQCLNKASYWNNNHPHGYRCGEAPPKDLAVNHQCHKTGDTSNLVACWSKESLLEKSDIPLNCFNQDYALSLHTLPGPHFLLLAQRKERMNGEECPSNVAFDYVQGGMAEVFMEDMGEFPQHLLGSRPLSDILQAQAKAKAYVEKAPEYNLETNTCLHYARDVWSSLGLADTAGMAEFIIEGVFNDSSFAELATKHSGGTGYLTAEAGGRQELRSYIKGVVDSQLDVTTA